MTARRVVHFTDAELVGGAEHALLLLLEHPDRDRWLPQLWYHETEATRPLAERAAALDVPLRAVEPLPLGAASVRRLPSFARLLRRERPALFHAHLSWPLAAKFPLAAAVAARIPSLATVQLYPDAEITAPSRLQLRLLARLVGGYLPVSQGTAERLHEELGIPRRKLHVIPNAVDAGRFAAGVGEPVRRELEPGDRSLVLAVGRLHEQKGHDVLLRAAADVTDACFALAGDGPERARLERLAAELGIADRVRFLGTRNDVPDLLAAADVVVLPSRYEGLPLSLLEAMAAGVPVVASRIPGNDELVEDRRTGVLVAPGDAAALAEALRQLLADPARRAALAEQGRKQVADRYTARAVADRVMEQYELLTRATAPSS
jgi:glycosyltransferase involved in cell wall biosynthesis